MDEGRIPQAYVAPLQLQKSGWGNDEVKDVVTQEDAYMLEKACSPRPKFQNFLRASYPFHPATAPSPSTVTLELNAGDIVLVHSIHTNGWADGTLLETGARGWLPTNYCEPYDYATMRPMLKAVTEFWDIIRSGNETHAGLFQNHDYMRGMVAGVRFLLEKSDCLTRDSGLVKRYDSIRKIRKALLADLSNLVKAAKQMQQLATNNSSLSDIDEVLDDMLLKAFQVVTRAVSFFDCWSEEVAFARETSCAIYSASNTRRSVTGSIHSQLSTTPASSGYTTRQHSMQSFVDDNSLVSRVRPSSMTSRRGTLTHRLSCVGRVTQGNVGHLASERLNTTYDAFLGVLASFLGSHMHSRSSSELLLTTQQAVKACRRLLSVVEVILEHDPAQSDLLKEAKDVMCDKITDLVLAAKQVFKPLQTADDDLIYLPSEDMQLVSAATACVSGAGRCVAKARVILEDMGDFELDSPPDSEQTSPVGPCEDMQPSRSSDQEYLGEDLSHSDKVTKPTLEIVTSPDSLAAVCDLSPNPETAVFWSPVSERLESPFLTQDTVHDQNSINSSHPQTRTQFSRPFMRDVIHSTGSESTLVSSVRNSGPSFVSQASTRATSPDRTTKSPIMASDPLDITDDITQLNDDHDEDDNDIMNHHYAHELLFNPEGRVVGGTLNAIVERLTAHDSTPDALFVSTIYLTFRLFTTPKEFTEALIYRFKSVDGYRKIAVPVRLRVFNVLKGWLESHWRHDCDEPALSVITEFVVGSVNPALSAVGGRLEELIDIISRTHQPPVPRALSTIGRSSTPLTERTTPDQIAPHPILSKSQLSALKTWRTGGSQVTILDFDPLELARQLTIRESSLFCSISPEELLATEFTKQSSSLSVNIRALAQLSTDLANLVADSILVLEEAKRRAATIKQWIKVASKCLELNNYDTLMAIICSINSSTILRLSRTWALVSQKTKTCFEALKKVIDVSKNYSTLRQRISSHVPPCLPFVGMYLTDLTFVDHGNPATRDLKNGDDIIPVINIDKHMKTAKIISDLQRFQVPYRLAEVSELQTWLQDELVRVRAAGERNFQNHYRRSLILEPRDTTQTRPNTVSTFASITSHKDKFDFLAWTHIGRDKTTSVGS